MIRIQEHVDELADVLLGHLLQRERGMFGGWLPGKEWDDVWNEPRRQSFDAGQDVDDPSAVARPQMLNVEHHRVESGLSARQSRDSCARNARFMAQPREHQLVGAARSLGTYGRMEASVVLQTALERPDVATIQTAGCDDATDRAGDGEHQNGWPVEGWHEEDRCAHQDAAARIAQPIEHDIDQRFRGTLLFCRDRRVEELVARTEPGAAQDRLAAARRNQTAETRRDQTDQAAEQQRDGRRAGRSAEAVTLEHHMGG